MFVLCVLVLVSTNNQQQWSVDSVSKNTCGNPDNEEFSVVNSLAAKISNREQQDLNNAACASKELYLT